MVLRTWLLFLLCAAVVTLHVAHKEREQQEGGSKRLRIAYCISGQLARLEVLSKIKNIIMPNAMAGHIAHVFVYLDDNSEGVKQTFWRYNYTDNLYNHMNASVLKSYMDQRIQEKILSSMAAQQAGVHNRVRTWVRIESPAQNNFTLRGLRIPVTNKTGPDFGNYTVEVEPAAVRWQNNMRWLSGLRECVKWIQAVELQQKWFYTTVVRLRDDTYAFGPWVLNADKYKNAFVSASFGSNFGINDRNFAVDRKYADGLFRGVTEDYYFNETLDLYSWGNPERRIYKVATSKDIALRNTSICDMPLLPLRGKLNATHWRIHVPYAQNMAAACEGEYFIERRRKRRRRLEGEEAEAPRDFVSPFTAKRKPTMFSLDYWMSWLWPATPPAAEAPEDEPDYDEEEDDAINEFMPCCKMSWLKMLKSGAARIFSIEYN